MERECFTDDRLRDHLEGQLPGAAEALIVEHLDDCERCRATLEGLAADTVILNVAREAGQSVPECDPNLDRLLATLQNFRPASAGPITEPVEQTFAVAADGWQQIGHYRVLEVVGRGGMGVALKARDEKLGRLVCLKVFAGPLVATETARQRWLREARAAAAIASQHVVKIYAVDEHQGRPYLAMEFVEGRSLQEELDRRGPLPIDEILEIARQTALGLSAAHARGLVHRDVKPGNILLEADTNNVKIADFGMARALDDARLTAEGCVAGTPEYMTPEQARGGAVDHRADLFSLGSVLYAMCTGRSPFAAENSLAVLRRVIDDKPVAVGALRPDMPEGLASLIRRLHEKDPARRPQSAAEVLELLARPKGKRSRTLSRRAAIVAGLVGVGSLAGAFYVTGGDDSQPLSNASGAAGMIAPTTPRAVTSRAVRVLIVLPPRDFYGLYYVGVRRQLDMHGVKCHVVSTNMHDSVSAPLTPEARVKPNLVIDYAQGGDYDLVYFCGGEIYEAGGSHASEANRIIDEALAANRGVAAIGRAPLILADAGVLAGRKAAVSRFGKPPGVYIERLKAAGVDWVPDRVVEDGPFLTARDPEDVQRFVTAMLKRLDVSLPQFHNLPPPND